MSKKIVFMLSGQGSQYYQMGKALFEHNTTYRNIMIQLNKELESALHIPSILDKLFSKKNKIGDIFDNLVYTSCAIIMSEYALAQVLMRSNITPDFLIGASLGTFAAGTISNVFSVKTALEKIMEALETTGEISTDGSMIGIMADPQLFQKSPVLNKNSELSSINFHSQFVVSCRNDKVGRIEHFLKNSGISYQVLPVTKAFHSSVLDPIESMFKSTMGSISFNKADIPIVCCSRAEAAPDFNSNFCWDIIRKPILFQKTIQNIEKENTCTYIDLGASGTFATYVKYILGKDSSSEYYAALSPFNRDLRNFERLIDTVSKKKIKQETKKMLTYVFPGQGSQKKGMGKELFNDFKEITKKADDILGYSIEELCLKDPHNQLGQTQYTQPALFTINALAYLKKKKETGLMPDFVAGHSLGEYNALFAAGAFDFETGLTIVQKRGELMSKATGGGMAAVIGLSEEDINKILKDNGFKNIHIANYNTPSQIVIAGDKKEIKLAKPVFEKSGAKLYIPLKVSGAFHTHYMDPAKKEFETFLEQFEFSKLIVPVMSNSHARPYQPGKIKENLVRQINSSVKWSESIRYLLGKGEMTFEEIGPGKVLSGLIKKIQNEATPLIVDDETAYSEQKDSLEKKLPPERQDETVSPTHSSQNITAYALGDETFKKDYNLKYAYLSGGMHRGISSEKMVVSMGKAGMMGFLGTGSMKKDEIEKSIQYIQGNLKNNEAYGMNLLKGPDEDIHVDLFLKYGVKTIEASGYLQLSQALVLYRLKGVKRLKNGSIDIQNKIIAKVSRPEAAKAFLSPAPERIVSRLLSENKITPEEMELSKIVSMADDVCVEADSGGHTDQGSAYALIPSMLKLRDDMQKTYKYPYKIRIGAAGGIGTPEASASAFMLGADFILTGSINQCTVEAGTSDTVKDLLQAINIQDTEYAPAGDMFELGEKVQVLKKGLFFPARANKLYAIYQWFDSLEEIDAKTKKQLEEKFFKRRFEDIFEECKADYSRDEINRAKRDPKLKMAMVFKWYFQLTERLALKGETERKADFQVYCGPALGAFNQWVKGSSLEDWRERHVDEIGVKLMDETAAILKDRLQAYL